MFLLASDTAAAGGIGIGFTLVYIVVIVVIMYFLAIRPQKKEQKKLNASWQSGSWRQRSDHQRFLRRCYRYHR